MTVPGLSWLPATRCNGTRPQVHRDPPDRAHRRGWRPARPPGTPHQVRVTEVGDPHVPEGNPVPVRGPAQTDHRPAVAPASLAGPGAGPGAPVRSGTRRTGSCG